MDNKKLKILINKDKPIKNMIDLLALEFACSYKIKYHSSFRKNIIIDSIEDATLLNLNLCVLSLSANV